MEYTDSATTKSFSRCRLQAAPEVVRVIVPESEAAGKTQPGTFFQAGVDVFIVENGITFLRNGRKHGRVGGITGVEQEVSSAPENPGQFFFQLQHKGIVAEISREPVAPLRAPPAVGTPPESAGAIRGSGPDQGSHWNRSPPFRHPATDAADYPLPAGRSASDNFRSMDFMPGQKYAEA